MDLQYLDDVIQAGIPATQDYALVAKVRHENPDWIVTGLSGTIGHSDLAGALTVRKRDGRSILDGRIAANRFDFDDLSSDEQQARAAADEKRTGKRILPDTAIHFEKLARTDGVIRFDAKKLIMKGKSPFVGLHATLTMDHRLLTVKPVEATLVPGTLGGTIVVDHRSGDPKLTVTLDLKGGRIEDIFTEAKDATAPLDGRIRLHGTGRTVREALGRGDGTIGLASRGGAMRLSVATLGAGDVVRGAKIALSDQRDAMTPIRCIIGTFTARRSQVTAGDLILDTEVMRAGGSGTVDLGTERIAADAERPLQAPRHHPVDGADPRRWDAGGADLRRRARRPLAAEEERARAHRRGHQEPQDPRRRRPRRGGARRAVQRAGRRGAALG